MTSVFNPPVKIASCAQLKNILSAPEDDFPLMAFHDSAGSGLMPADGS